MDLNKTDLNLLPVFDALLKTGSVTRAGQLIGLSQPAMSYALAKLRFQLGDPLFVRSGRTMLPTPHARALAAPVAEVLDTVRRRILAGGGFEPATARREFSLCLTDIGGLVFLPRLLARLRHDAPGCTLRSQQLPATVLSEALESGEVDVAIGYFPDLGGGMSSQKLYAREYVCAFRAGHPAIGNRLSLKQYAALDHVLIRTPVRAHDAVQSALARQGLTRRVALSVPHYTVVPPILEQTDLIATIPAEIGSVFARFANTRMLPLPVRLPDVILRQYWHRRFQEDPSNAWLRGLVSELFAEQ